MRRYTWIWVVVLALAAAPSERLWSSTDCQACCKEVEETPVPFVVSRSLRAPCNKSKSIDASPCCSPSAPSGSACLPT